VSQTMATAIISKCTERIFKCMLLALLSLAFILPIEKVHSSERIQNITIVRGIGDYPPLEMIEDGQLTGLHIDMIRYIADKLDINVEFLSLPWGRAIQYFSSGKAHAISYYGYTKQRELHAIYHTENILSNTRWVFLALEERKNEFSFDRNLNGLEKLVIGVQHGYSHGEYFDSMKHLVRDMVLTEFDLERMLKNKRHDLAMMSHQEFLGFKKRGDFQGIVALTPSIDTDAQYLAFSRNIKLKGEGEVLAKAFAIEFRKYKNSQAYKNLLNRYQFQDYR